MKLGFVVKPNGTFGPATKAALESFERDQHLPVKGEMSRKILRQLSAESGVAID
jgi:peptidoglycan hydrolase-like protein with peptidoglycan-binding domain